MKKYLILLISFFSINIIAQSHIKFDFDYAQFKYDSTSNYLEIYYSFVFSDNKQKSEEQDSMINVKMHIQIQNKETDELIVNKDWGLNKKIKNSTDNLDSKVVLGVVEFKLKKGSYNLDVRIEDMDDESYIKEFSENLVVTPIDRKSLAVSNIELATRIINENADKNSIFYKNTLEVFPNPSIIYTEQTPVLFYYSELYNIDLYKEKPIYLSKKLFDSKNNLVYESSKEVKTDLGSIVDVGVVNLKKYATDSYTLALSLGQKESNTQYSSAKKFFLINPGVKIVQNTAPINDYVKSEFGVLENEECDDLFDKSKFLAQKFEKDEYEKMTNVNQKREFLFNFWKKRDDNPETSENEFKRIYLDRVDFANARYKTMFSPGYKTDMGRVTLLYGQADEVNRFPNETNTKPYETWHYNSIEGGVIFIFADQTGYNNYELIHSTKRGELQDPNWMNRISAN